jgi:hypothetical protein
MNAQRNGPDGASPTRGAAATAERSREPGAPPPPESRGLGRPLVGGVLFGLVVLAVMAGWADLRGMGDALARFPLHLAAVACALSFANYGLRFLRWQRYLRVLGIQIPTGTSYLIHLAGLALTISPGKMGEAFKSWLVKRVSPCRRACRNSR